MKKCFVFILILIVCNISFANRPKHIQHNRIIKVEGHIMFKGLSLDQNIDSFTNKLINLGYKRDFKKDTIKHTAYLKGLFATDSCEICICYTPISKKVYFIDVMTTPYNDWQSVKDEYVHLKEQFSLKYGKPFICEENSLDVCLNGDRLEMEALQKPDFKFESAYNIINGTIILAITKGGDGYPYISMVYGDSVNSKMNDKEENSKVQDDI